MTRSRSFRNHPLSVFIFLCVAVGFGLPPANLSPVPATSVESISSTELRMHLKFLTSEELGGRYTLASNFSVAARYLAAHLEAYGFHGAGDHGDFLQHFAVISSKPDAQKCTLSIITQGKTDSYSFGDFYPMGSSDRKAEGHIVFMGYGISAPAQNHDDYATTDVKGKIVLIASGVPEGIDRSLLGEDAAGERAAAAHGAVGVLEIPSPRFLEFMKRKEFKERAASREAIRLAKEAEGTLPVGVLSPDLVEKLLPSLGLHWKEVEEAEKEGKPLAPKDTEASAALAVAFHQRQTMTQNVVGILKGTDSSLKNEYITLSAHYDHLQTNEKGEIYPGADDDGSGTTSVLTIAHAMAINRPRRSVMVIFHAGEELGLLGSKYNTDYSPAVPLEQIVADLNIDMIGRSKPVDDHEKLDEHLTGPNTIYLVGSNRISKELHNISEETNSDYQKLKLDYYYNDPSNPEMIYFRSDHWNYAKHGIPVIFYFDGTHVDYHRPTDTIDKIDFEKMTKVARLVFETGFRIANLDHRLAKDAK